jgi:serine/arginine repetitive matrix protein 2
LSLPARLPEEEIEQKLAAHRTTLLAQLDQAAATTGQDLGQETHAVAQRKLEQMARLKNAFGFGEEVKEGDAFNRELQEQKRLEKIEEREQEKKRREKEKKDAARKCVTAGHLCVCFHVS